MKNLNLMVLSLTALISVWISAAHAQSVTRNKAEYNLVGLKGYDPVAVFPEGGGVATKGDLQFGVEYGGVFYYFASASHLDMFNKSPAKYEPTYGGYCAYAMASGSKVDIQPDLFTIHGNRAHYFVSRRAKQNFDADVGGYETRADDFWRKISGEEPRH